MPSPTHLILRITVCLSAPCLISGCGSRDARAQQAIEDYQGAAAANDLPGAHKALLQLVNAKEDVPDYWVELGKFEASAGRYGEAYYAFTRAYELNRADPNVLQSITEMALRMGDLSAAEEHARELEILSPGNPWIKLTDGWAALKELRYADALATSDQMLATLPNNPAATVLKAQALVGLNRDDEARALLVKQLQTQPADVVSAKMLAKFYVRHEQWAPAAVAARSIIQQSPGDTDAGLLFIEAAFRSGHTADGRSASARLLTPTADPNLIASVLDLWEHYWPSPERLLDARRLANAAAGSSQRLVYSAFLNRLGSPQDSLRLVASLASLPVDATNAEANAVLGDALWRTGDLRGAKSRLDSVITYDPGNATALRGRAEFFLRSGNVAGALVDAQKLVTVLPKSPSARLLLARCYMASGNKRWADRTLWTAFQDIPADEQIYAALRLTRSGDSEATQDLQEEFERQQDAKLNRGMV
jgi:predicted Zn-dependent protease